MTLWFINTERWYDRCGWPKGKLPKNNNNCKKIVLKNSFPNRFWLWFNDMCGVVGCGSLIRVVCGLWFNDMCGVVVDQPEHWPSSHSHCASPTGCAPGQSTMWRIPKIQKLETSGSRKVCSREGPGGASGSGGAVKLEASIFDSIPEHRQYNIDNILSLFCHYFVTICQYLTASLNIVNIISTIFCHYFVNIWQHPWTVSQIITVFFMRPSVHLYTS